MIHQIKSDKQLIPYLCDVIEDEGIEVGIEEGLAGEKLAIIKVDDYYNGQHMPLTPKAIDYLVVVDCECDAYVMYLFELKNVKSPKFLEIGSIHEKFETTIEDFLSKRFDTIFMNDKYKYKKILLYLISDAYGISGRYGSYGEYRALCDKINRKDSLKVERNLGAKLFRFRGKILHISYDIPPNPIVQKIS